MYAIDITADKFKGLNMVKQHRLVNEFLKDDLKRWHGLRLNTKAP
jgi:stress-induced morphogen